MNETVLYYILLFTGACIFWLGVILAFKNHRSLLSRLVNLFSATVMVALFVAIFYMDVQVRHATVSLIMAALAVISIFRSPSRWLDKSD